MRRGSSQDMVRRQHVQVFTLPANRTERCPASAPRSRLAWWRGWGPLLFLPGLVLLTAPRWWPRWAVMWALAFALYGGCKWLTWRRTPVPGVPAWRHLAYVLAWPGMDAAAFLNPHAFPPKPAAWEWLFATARLCLGPGLFGVAWLISPRFPYAAGWVGMVGVILALHFGAFHLLSCVWRRAGVRASPLMDRPLASASVGEFWGRRWNTAFRDLTHRFLFRPFTAWMGPRPAVLAGFLFSGLVHELVISVPAGGGYGGPTLFFAVQGVAVLMERAHRGRRSRPGRGRAGRLFTVLVLVVPAYALFHPPFVLGVVLPFIRALGGAS